MKPIIGVYLGWVPPNGTEWEPMYRTMRCQGGYKSDPTPLRQPTLDRYPGYEEILGFYPDPLELPWALERRTPLVRLDYEMDAKLLGLSYPHLDLFEYIGRTGGLFSGDVFSVCPVIEPNDDDSFSYEATLLKWDREVRDSLSENTQLQAISSEGKSLIVTSDDRILGELGPEYALLGDTIFNVKLIRIGERYELGGGEVFISFDTPLNLYATPNFVVATLEVAIA
jgi:hypothetical protein